MIKVICTKAQYKRLINVLMESRVIDGRCVLGRNENTCPICTGESDEKDCRRCLEKNLKRVPEIKRYDRAQCPCNEEGICQLDDRNCSEECEIALWGRHVAAKIARRILDEVELAARHRADEAKELRAKESNAFAAERYKGEYLGAAIILSDIEMLRRKHECGDEK